MTRVLFNIYGDRFLVLDFFLNPSLNMFMLTCIVSVFTNKICLNPREKDRKDRVWTDYICPNPSNLVSKYCIFTSIFV